jgi:hypothetical protein
MPPRRDLEQADLAARTMFNVFPQGVGERVDRGARSLAESAMGAISRFTNPLGALASDIGAARQAVSGTRLIGPMTGFQVPPTPPTPVLPSGTPMTGFDIYPTQPQMAPRTTMAMAPQPAAPMLGASTPVPTFPTSGMGIMGNQNISPLPTEQISPMTRMAPTIADRGNVTTDITGMQGKTPIQTPYGTVYATAGQAGTQRVAEMANLPAQSARLAQIGERARGMGMARQGGQQIAQGYTETMQRFARSAIPEGVREREMPAPQGRFGQPLVSNFPRSREAMTQARQTVSPAATMASFAPVQAPSPFIEDQFRNPFSSIYGFSA